MPRKITAVVGTYRKGQTIDSAVTQLLRAARQHGAEINKIQLLDKNIEFCTNCRKCMQEKISGPRDKCVHNDDMAQILDEIDAADGVVLASPINWFNVTALMKRFIERLTCYGYWPWGSSIPQNRVKKLTKKAVLIVSSACPEFWGRIFFAGSFKILKAAANCVGAKVVKKIYIGSAATSQKQPLPEKYRKRLCDAGKVLAS